jgi:hypothetical protein
LVSYVRAVGPPTQRCFIYEPIGIDAFLDSPCLPNHDDQLRVKRPREVGRNGELYFAVVDSLLWSNYVCR